MSLILSSNNIPKNFFNNYKMDNINQKLISMQEVSKMKLAKLLHSEINPKILIIDNNLIPQLDYICGIKWLRNNGIHKIFKLELNVLTQGCTGAIYFLISSNMKSFKVAVNEIRSFLTKKSKQNDNITKFYIIVSPKSQYVFAEELEHLGLLHDVVELYSFQWLPICLDNNILSMETPQIFTDLYINRSTTLLPSLANSLWEIFAIFGIPKRCISVGHFSSLVLNQIDILLNEDEVFEKGTASFETVLIIDRSIDYISPLLTPGTYTALLNEVFNINCGKFDINKLKHENSSNEDKSEKLTSNQSIQIILNGHYDSIYSEIKNCHFTEVPTVLGQCTKKIKSEESLSKQLDLQAMTKYVETKLKELKSKKKHISNHLSASEKIVENMGGKFECLQNIQENTMRNLNKKDVIKSLYEYLIKDKDVVKTIRLFCLINITQKLTKSETREFWKTFLYEFGFEYGYIFKNLTNAGFISDDFKLNKNDKLYNTNYIGNFYKNASNFYQIPLQNKTIDLKNPTCPSYVFSGCYIPLIAKIATILFSTNGLVEIKSKFEGTCPIQIRNYNDSSFKEKSLIIFVVGGLTYAEVAACKLLEKQTDYKILLMSDNIVSGNSLIQQVVHSSHNVYL